jgi:hypothetical protein
VAFSEVEAGSFTSVYSCLLNVGRSVLKMTETLWKNCLTVVKDVFITHENFIFIAIAFSEKEIGGITFVPHPL